VKSPTFKPTKPIAMAFEQRAKERPKPISQIKLEQDLELRRREEEAAYAFRFVPNKVPPKSSKQSDGLFEQQMEEAAAAAAQRVAERKTELTRMLGSDKGPPAFYERDMAKLEAKKRMLQAMKQDINRFQVKFTAKEVPASVKQQRYAALQAEMRQRKEHARAEAKEKLDRVNEEFGAVQQRVADAMAAEMKPFPGTVEDNITGARLAPASAASACIRAPATTELPAHGSKRGANGECSQARARPTSARWTPRPSWPRSPWACTTPSWRWAASTRRCWARRRATT